MFLWIVIQSAITFALIFYFYIRRKYTYWSSRGVSGPRPIYPFGYTWDKARNDPFELETRWLRDYGKVYGVYTGLLPTLIVADPELIKQIMIKDFAHFANRRILNSYHSVWNHNLFSVDYEEWKVYRSTTTPAFSTGKLRNMNPLIGQCIQQLFAKFDSLGESGTFIPKELFTNFSIDITSATFFATETNANSASGEMSPIARQCLALADIPAFRSAAVGTLPRPLLNLLGITSVFREGALAFICNLLRTIVKQQKSIPASQQNDFIRLLSSDSSSANENSRKLSDNEVIAQCLIFFLASYEQIASVMTYCAYELAQNPHIQDRLVEEIQKKLGNDELELEELNTNFETLMSEIPYLEAVIKEALRKYPPELRMERRVSAEGARIGELLIEKDTLIEIPTIALHHNPEYFPNPQLYDPERFMPENRDNLVPYSFLPFGAGPRNCIGMRFAYQVVKMTLASLVLRYRLEPARDTPKKLSFVSGNLSLLIPLFPLAINRR